MIDPKVVREWVERSCAAQGVPVHIEDPVVIQKLVVLLRPWQ